MSMGQQPRISELAAQIASNSALVERHLQSNQLALPSFHCDGPTNLVMSDPEVEKARIAAIDASIELQDLLQGPQSCLRPAINATALEAIYRWDIPKHVPLDGDISYGELASQVAEPNLRRIVRLAAVHHRVFREPRYGFVTHSAASRLLVDDPTSFDCLGMMFDESWQAFARTCDAMKEFGGDELNQTGYALAHGQGQTVWEHYEANPAWGKRFANSMKAFTSATGQSVASIVDGYPWSSLAEGSTIVDVGGSEGHVSVAIAKAQPHLKFVVQDLPEVIVNAEKESKAPESVQSRIKYEGHDFLTPQKTEGDIYLFRWIFHDWPDAYVLKILRNLIPSLKDGAKVIVNEQLMPPPGAVPLVTERQIRFFDMVMLSFFNAREREPVDWERLFPEADSRFRHVRVWKPPGETFSLVEATWIA